MSSSLSCPSFLVVNSIAWILNFYVLPLSIVQINCTIVRVIEAQRLEVVLHNRIFEGTYLT
jgi:hypothetical protein